MARKNFLPFPLSPLLLLTAIFYLNFISRVILAPLLPVMQSDLGLSHGQAGSLFFYIACGYGSGLFGSAFIAAWLNHRRTIILSIFNRWIIIGNGRLPFPFIYKNIPHP